MDGRWARGAVAALAIAGVLGAGVIGTRAQDAPARAVVLHEGDCKDLGDAVADLTEATLPVGDRIGSEDATSAATSFTRAPILLADLLAESHAIDIKTTLGGDTSLACGEIGGTVDELGGLVIGLHESQDSGYSGVAFLAADDANGVTNVSVFVAPSRDPNAIPTATPAPTSTPAPTNTPEPTWTPAPTFTPVPTYTPLPTYTPVPTATPTPTPVFGAVDVVLADGRISIPERLAVGPVVLTITNEGTEAHTFVLQGEAGNTYFLDEELQPGETGTLSFYLPPGNYTAYCSAADGAHAETEVAAVEGVVEE